MSITLSDGQKQLFDKLLTEKVAADEHANWRHHALKDWDAFNRALRVLKYDRAYLPEQARPTAEGLYRDPETNKLYRLKKQNWDLIVSVYSKTAALRLTHDLEVVEKGTWKKLNAWDSRRTLDKLRAAWLMSDEDKVQYKTGVCNFCYRGLEDARSVWHNYGPVCAKNYGLPWGDLPESHSH